MKGDKSRDLRVAVCSFVRGIKAVPAKNMNAGVPAERHCSIQSVSCRIKMLGCKAGFQECVNRVFCKMQAWLRTSFRL